MRHPRHKFTGKHIASPYGLAMVSSVVFLAACIFPPDIYKRLMNEPDLMFLDVRSMFFYGLCVGCFLLGVLLVDKVPSRPFTDDGIEISISPAAFILIPLLIALGLNVFSIIAAMENGVLVSLLLLGQGGAVKEALYAQGSLFLSSTALLGVLWWAIWRYQQLQVRGMSGWVTRVPLYVATLSAVVSASLLLDRGQLMSILVGTAIIFYLRKVARNQVSRGFVMKSGALLLLAVTVAFVLPATIRGADEPEKVAASFVAYTIASYNRLSAVLSGDLRYPYAGTGVYLCGFLPFNNLFNRIFPLREVFNWPSFIAFWKSQFGAVESAGLNGNSIWSGAFGYIFADIGWFAPLFLFVHGVLTGWAWRSIRLGRSMGIVLYPWCALCILQWFGPPSPLLSTSLAALLIVSVFLAIYESLLVRQKATSYQGRLVRRSRSRLRGAAVVRNSFGGLATPR